MKRIFQTIGASLMTGVCVVVLSGPGALAGPAKTGTQGCTHNQTGVLWSYASGNVRHLAPGASKFHFFNDGYELRERSNSADRPNGGKWTVLGLDVNSAHAYCINGRP